jgi:glutathione-regulated potassium-efflux system ancillary protein KefC
MDPLPILLAFALGFAARLTGLPPLVGYLAAGFALSAVGFETNDAIEVVSDLGILLLLFGIGLKLRIRTLAIPAVWGTAIANTAVTVVMFTLTLLGLAAAGLGSASELDIGAILTVGFAMSFASTVFAVKALERDNESASLAGRLAIGVLVFQDVLAVGFLAFAGGTMPSPWAIAVVGGLVLFRPVFGWLLDRSDHGEILMLLGFVLAAGVGSTLFELVDLKPDLGALVMGVLLAGHQRAGEMADRLLGLKDLLLIGFFLSIGLQGWPELGGWVIAVVAIPIMVARTAAMFWTLTRFRLRARTSLHTSLSLATYSEFGLIVAAAAVSAGLLASDWVQTIAMTVAGSFATGAVFSALRYRLYGAFSGRMVSLERHPIVADDAVIDFGPCRVLVFGMGRVGTGAYDELVLRRGPVVVGVDRSDDRVAAHRAEGRAVVRGDALDRDFWERVRLHPDIELVVAAMSSHEGNLECARRVEEFAPDARIAAIATYPDQVEELRAAGVDVARNLYEEAGQGLADDAVGEIWGAQD